MKRVSERRVRLAKLAKSVLKRRLRSNPNVIGIGIGYRERRGELKSTLCVRVHVKKKYAIGLVPDKYRIPPRVRGIAVDVIEGEYFPSQGIDPTSRAEPLVGGVMIANRTNYPQVGTLGAVMVDLLTGERLVLSNWHVLYGRIHAIDGESVVQPRPVGSGNVIGKTRVGILSNSVDCAVAALDGIRGSTGALLGLASRVNSSVEPALGMRVAKSGVNGVAFGTVDEIELEHEFSYPTGPLVLKRQIRIKVDPASRPSLGERDSGSLWVTETEHRAVGLHFAGSSSLGVGVANRMTDVVKAIRSAGISMGFI